MFVSIQRGYGKRSEALTEAQITSAIKAEVIGQFFAIASFPSGKASIAYLLQRIFPGKKLQWFLWSFVAANAICFYVDSVLILVQCQPVAFQWDHTIPGGKCWDSRVVVDWGFLTGSTSRLTFIRLYKFQADMISSYWCPYRLLLCRPALVLSQEASDGPQGENHHWRCPQYGFLRHRLFFSQDLLYLDFRVTPRFYL